MVKLQSKAAVENTITQLQPSVTEMDRATRITFYAITEEICKDQ